MLGRARRAESVSAHLSIIRSRAETSGKMGCAFSRLTGTMPIPEPFGTSQIQATIRFPIHNETLTL